MGWHDWAQVRRRMHAHSHTVVPWAEFALGTSMQNLVPAMARAAVVIVPSSLTKTDGGGDAGGGDGGSSGSGGTNGGLASEGGACGQSCMLAKLHADQVSKSTHVAAACPAKARSSVAQSARPVAPSARVAIATHGVICANKGAQR